MSTTDLEERLSKSLNLYYSSLDNGDMKSLKELMTQESYMISLDSLGFKRAFKDSHFKAILENINDDDSALLKVEEILSEELRSNPKNHDIGVVNIEENGPDRYTLHYLEDTRPKKMYFSSSSGEWKIDYMAGRKVT